MCIRDSIGKKIDVGLHSGICRRISFKLNMIGETSKLYILTLVWMTLTFIQLSSRLYKKSKTLVSIFLQTEVLIWIKYSVATTCLFKLMLFLFCTGAIQRREIC